MINHLYIKWAEKNNTGIAIIDEQHKAIISTINSYYYFVESGKGQEVIKIILQMLIDYTKLHFITEEGIMNEADYPEYEQHCSKHKILNDKTVEFLSNRNLDSREVLKFLKEWWLKHINIEDKKYVPFIKI